MKKNKVKYYMVFITGVENGAYASIVDIITEGELQDIIKTKCYIKGDINIFVEVMYKKKMKCVNLKGE